MTSVLAVVALLLLFVAWLGCGLVALQIVAVRSFARQRTRPPAASLPVAGVTVLKPLHGAEPGLDANLASFARQRYAGPMQLLFGVAAADDAAVASVERLRLAFPQIRIDLVVSGPAGSGNAKIANLVAMSAAIQHRIVVLSDSDIRVEPDYLERTVAALQQPGTGLVTCLYRGASESGFWGSTAAMWIDERFFPSVLLGMRLGRARPCVGATMAFSAATLARIGGFAAFAHHLADDYAIGEAVRASGQAVVVAAHVVEHRSDESSLGAVFAHELRWARTIRGLDPAGHATSFVLHPLPFALAGTLCAAWAAPALAAPAAAWLVFAALGTCLAALLGRAWLQIEASRALGHGDPVSPARLLLGPARDILSALVFAASFWTDAVVWRGRRFRVRRDGTMIEST